MTPRELLRAINLPEDEFHIKWAQDTMDLAAVIERDTPKKPNTRYSNNHVCTHCGALVYRTEFCQACGQRLDWSKE